MVNFTIEQMRAIMEKSENIRNISVIAHVDHGKTTLTTSLIARAGITSSDNVDFLDSSEQSKQKGITIKSTGVSLCHELNSVTFLINLIDSPGHVDFSSEVTAALRVTDGALVVVDAVEGVCVQTETVLRQAMGEKICPIVMINKVDRAILEQQLDGEAIYQQFCKVIDHVNVIISGNEQPNMGDVTVHPTKNTVAFGSGKDGWGFNLQTFARMYSKKFKIDENKLVQKLWDEHYYDPETKTWLDQPVSQSGKTLKRAFVQFIMDPIIKITNTILTGTQEQIEKMINQLEIVLTKEEKTLVGKYLLRSVLSKWINGPDTLLEMIVTSLPSPKVAQKYRVDYLYEGPQDDICAQAIRECDAKGPLMIYISKMVPAGDAGRFYAFGRVFSGTVCSGQKVRIMGPNYTPGSKEDLALKSIQRTVIMMGKNAEAISDVPCGNTVGLTGIDKYLLKTGTVTDCEDAHNFRVMKFSVSPVVRVAVQPKNPVDLPKLIEGLNRLVRHDSIVQVIKEETGEFIVAGCGELHVDICLHDLEHELACIPIIRSDPVVTYKETITSSSTEPSLSKSSNKLNRIFATAQPLGDELTNYLENGNLAILTDAKERTKILVDQFDWDKEEALKLWSFGPENTGANILVDATKGIQGMQDIRDSMESGFNWAMREGVLCNENMRGVRVNLTDAKIHSDPAHRGTGQILEMARRVYYATELSNQPRLQEPVFLAEISVPSDFTGGVYQCLNQRRGEIIEEVPVTGSANNIIRAYLPVAESFGFTQHLRSVTGGRAFPQCVFDHWSEFMEDPLDKNTKAHQIVKAIRKRKGLKDELPTLSMYVDKL
jgi:elongation factor 2